MSAQSQTLRLNIDAAAAEAGARAFMSSLAKIRRASKDDIGAVAGQFTRLNNSIQKLDASKLNQFEASLKAFKNVGKGAQNFNQFANALRSLKVPSASRIKNLERLSEAVKGFRGTNGSVADFGEFARSLSSFRVPSERQVKNLRDMMFAISNFRAPVGMSGLADLGRTVSGFRAPSESGVRRLEQFVRLISGMRMPKGNVGGYSQLSASLAGFRAPTKTQIENFERFLRMLDTARAPRNVRAIADALDQIAISASRASRAIRPIAGLMRDLPRSAFNANRGFRTMNHGLRGMENAFNATYQAGSLLRSMLGSLTIAEFSRGLWDANTTALRAATAFRVAAGSIEGANEEMDFATQLALNTGQALDVVIPRYSKFAVASQMAGFAAESTRQVYGATSAALTVLGASAHDSELAFLALEQMVSKGTIQSEELRRQLSERLPGAFSAMARAAQNIGLIDAEIEQPTQALNDLMRTGSLLSHEVLPEFARELMRTYGSELEEALRRPDVALNSLRTQFFLFRQVVGGAGFMEAMGIQLDRIAQIMSRPEFREFGEMLGEGLGKMVNKLGDAFAYVLENIETFSAIVGIAAWAVFSRTLWDMGSAAQWFFRPLSSIAAGAGNVVAGLRAMTGASTMLGVAMRAIPVVGLIAGLATLGSWLYRNRTETVSFAGHTAELGDVFVAAWSTMRDKAVELWQSLTSGLDWVGDAFGETIGWINRTFGAAFENIDLSWEGTVQFMIGLADSLIKGFLIVKESIMGVFRAIAAAAVATFEPLLGMIDDIRNQDFGSAAAKLFEMNPAATIDRQLTAVSESANRTREAIEGIIEADGHFATLSRNIMEEAEARTRERANRPASDPLQTRDPDFLADLFGGGGDNTVDRSNQHFSGLSGNELERWRNNLQNIVDTYDVLGAATREYEEHYNALADAHRDGLITEDQLVTLRERLDDVTRDARRPFEAMTRDYREQLELLQMSEPQRRIEIAQRDAVNQLMEAGVILTQAQNEELRGYIEAIDAMENRTGFDAFIEDAGTLQERLGDLQYMVADEFSNALADMATTGQASFRQLGQAILAEINRVMAQQLVRSFIQMLRGESDDSSSGSSGPSFLETLFRGGQGGNGSRRGAEGVGSSIGETFNRVAGRLFNSEQGGGGFLSRLGGVFSSERGGGGFLSGLGNAFQSGGNMFQNLFSGLGSLFGGMGGGGGGFGGLLQGISPLLNFIPGVGPLLSMGANLLGGLFSEGGYSTAAVSSRSVPVDMFKNARHFSEGTQNISGGIPAILHPEEAVVPLSRGRKIPVELTGSRDNVSKNDSAGGDVSLSLHIDSIVIEGAKDEDTAARGGAAAGREMKKAMRQLLTEETRPGGVLYKYKKAA